MHIKVKWVLQISLVNKKVHEENVRKAGNTCNIFYAEAIFLGIFSPRVVPFTCISI